MVWVYIDDPGVPGHEAFNGYMSKYETTNAQYCEYLNAALASGDIYVSDNIIYGSNGSNSGVDFVDITYFDTSTGNSYSQITYNGHTFSVRSRDGYSMAKHPVVQVNWFGATAFCNYYGYRLPTEWEWQAVADFDDNRIYGCGTTIDQSMVNYGEANPLNLSSEPYTSPVDYYSSYGYGMNDMAGNVWEWTTSCDDADCVYSFRAVRGGCWLYNDYNCMVAHQYSDPRQHKHSTVGFRVCR
jgi:formylglycine-generating enzyme required for sulfatase activity